MTPEDYETTNVEAAARYAMELGRDEVWPDDRVVLSDAAMEWLAHLGRTARANREEDE